MRPETPVASRFVLADSSNYTKRSKAFNGYDLIIIHCTDGHANALPVAQMWQEPHHGSSAHFVIGQDGEIIQCVPLAYASYHAHSINERSIGIEHCARTPGELGKGDPGLKPTEVQYRKSAQIVAWLLVAAGLKPERGVTIKGHAEADPTTTHTRCPDGCGWDWDGYLAMVNEEYAKLATPSAPFVA